MKVKKLVKILKCCRFHCSIKIFYTDVFGSVPDNCSAVHIYGTDKKLDKLYGEAKIAVWDLKRGHNNLCNQMNIWIYMGKKPKTKEEVKEDETEG